ncbi:hypothetical protein Tco_0703192 [Tanacetum coccineum]|uniref:Uncharacterized protein n=1 Tax=Tanacetum coccineum TaxID=301880 RepID=A0ABQ4XZN2_9ASTR
MIDFIFKIDLHRSPLKASLHKHGMKLLLPKLLEHGVRLFCRKMRPKQSKFSGREIKKPESSEDESINKVGDDDSDGVGEQKGDDVYDEDFYDNRDKDLFNDGGDDE